jgi:SecD/SecF fusion protein
MTRKRHFNYFTGISRKIFEHSAFKFIENRKSTYVISAIVFALGIGSYFNGFGEGVEFEGGRSYTIKFEKAVNQQRK